MKFHGVVTTTTILELGVTTMMMLLSFKQLSRAEICSWYHCWFIASVHILSLLDFEAFST